MTAVRPSARPRALVALTVASALVFGACGGKSHSKSTPSTQAPSTATASGVSTGTTAVKARCETPPGKQTARIRFVNLYTNPKYPKSAVDVWQGLGADDPCAKKLTTVPFGQAGDYVDITASDASGNWSAAAYVAGSNDKAHEIVVQGEKWLGGEQATMVFEGAAPQAGAGASPSAGSDQTFLEKNNVGDPGLLVPEAGKAALGVTSALKNVVDNGTWVVGSPKSGCIARPRRHGVDAHERRRVATRPLFRRSRCDRPGVLPGCPGHVCGSARHRSCDRERRAGFQFVRHRVRP